MTAWTILHDLMAVVVMAGGGIVFFEAMLVAVEAADRSRRRAAADDQTPWGDVVSLHPEARVSHRRSNTLSEEQDNVCR